MKILALIPARGGSKRLPGKNIRILGGKPLLAWSIDICKDIECVVDVMVSTDSAEVAKVAKKFGALVPWLRPEILSRDNSTTVDVLIHEVTLYQTTYGKVDAILLLQPTNPFRKINKLHTAISKFLEYEGKYSVMTFTPVDIHPYWMFKESGDFVMPFFSTTELQIRSQELPKAFKLNGNFYLIPVDFLLSRKTLYTDSIFPIIIDSDEENIDIDTQEDWDEAEKYIKDNSGNFQS